MGDATQVLTWIAAGFALVGVLLLFAAFGALRRRRPFGFTIRGLTAFALLACAALAATLGVSTLGYEALTRETVAARVTVKPVGPQDFKAEFRFPDGRTAEYALRGDQIYVDAHVLKWKPLANLFGLHTAYELDRVAGRYAAIEKERDSPHTVHALGTREAARRVRPAWPVHPAPAAARRRIRIGHVRPGGPAHGIRSACLTTGLLIRPLVPGG